MDEYAVNAVVRWDDDGSVKVLWEMESSSYGFTVAPEIFDQMYLGEQSIDDPEVNAPVVMQMMVFDD